MANVEQFEGGLTFTRIDADPSSVLNEQNEAHENHDSLVALFKNSIDEDIPVEVQAFRDADTPAMIFVSEEAHRMNEMSKLYGFIMPGVGDDKKLFLNSNNSLVKSLLAGDVGDEDAVVLSEHIWDIASLSHKHLDPDRMSKFIQRNVMILQRFTK